MTSKRTLTVEHDGTTYYGHVATIDATTLGWEDHGVLSAMLHTSWSGGGVSVGGFCLDKSTGAPDYERRGTAYGLDHIMRVMETVGVRNWEDLKGRQVIVLFDAENSWGSTSKGIAGLTNDKVLILKDHAESWRESEVTAR